MIKTSIVTPWKSACILFMRLFFGFDSWHYDKEIKNSSQGSLLRNYIDIKGKIVEGKEEERRIRIEWELVSKFKENKEKGQLTQRQKDRKTKKEKEEKGIPRDWKDLSWTWFIL